MDLTLAGKPYLLLVGFLLVMPLQAQDWYESYLYSQKTVLKETMSTDNAPAVFDLGSQNVPQKKSVFSAFLLSLAVPGLGESYVGASHYLPIFLSTEVIGWGLYISNLVQVNTREEQYKNYATQHAGIDDQNKDVQYWIDIGKSESIYEHNEQSRRNRDIEAIYPEIKQNFWSWDSEENLRFYEWQRIRTREIERREVYYIGGIVLNHLVSAINAIRLARAYNRKQAELSWNLDFDFEPRTARMQLNFVKTF